MLPTNGDKKISKNKCPIHNTRNLLCMGCECPESVGPKFFLVYSLEKSYSLLTSWVRIIFLWVCHRSKSFSRGYYVLLLCIMCQLMYYFVSSALQFWANPTLFIYHIALDTTFCLIINNLIYVNFNLGVVVSITHNTTIQQSYFWWNRAISLEQWDRQSTSTKMLRL